MCALLRSSWFHGSASIEALESEELIFDCSGVFVLIVFKLCWSIRCADIVHLVEATGTSGCGVCLFVVLLCSVK